VRDNLKFKALRSMHILFHSVASGMMIHEGLEMKSVARSLNNSCVWCFGCFDFVIIWI